MKESLNFTLYEIFGYLMPGLVAFAGIIVLFWVVFHGESVLPLSLWRISSSGILAILFIAYLLGHAVQALANVIFTGADREVISDVKNPIIAVARTRAQAMFPEIEKELDDHMWLVRVMDECCIQGGHEGDREIFTYREGFYRGAMLAALVFGTGILMSAVIGNLKFRIGEAVLIPSRWELGLALLITLLLALGFYKRFQRFSQFRVSRVIAAFLVLSRKPQA